MKTILKLLAIDEALGRVDPMTLSDQAMMEILVDGLSEDSKVGFCTEQGQLKDVCEWTGVECTPEGKVSKITFNYGHDGELALAFIPRSVQIF